LRCAADQAAIGVEGVALEFAQRSDGFEDAHGVVEAGDSGKAKPPGSPTD